MTDAFMMSDTATLTRREPSSQQAGCAGSQLYQAWSAKKATGASRRAAEREYRVLLVLAFTVLLPVVAVSRLLPSRLSGGCSPHRSLFAETRAKADAILPIVFMA